MRAANSSNGIGWPLVSPCTVGSCRAMASWIAIRPSPAISTGGAAPSTINSSGARVPASLVTARYSRANCCGRKELRRILFASTIA
jgi:hypothetical protein